MDEATEQDIPELYPSLLSLGRPTTLLNWTPGEAAIRESSMGGRLLWPRSEPWPVCERRHGHLANTGFVEKDESNEPEAHLVALLQLRATDVPTIRFPEGMDLVQILWCPALHLEGGVPAPVIYWRDTAQVSDALDRHPPVRESQSEGRPFPCVPTPEALLDFPDPIDLPADAARQAFGDDDPEDEADTYAELVRDRWADKAGGYPYVPAVLPGVQHGNAPAGAALQPETRTRSSRKPRPVRPRGADGDLHVRDLPGHAHSSQRPVTARTRPTHPSGCVRRGSLPALPVHSAPESGWQR